MDSTDPLLFICELSNVIGLRVILPNGVQEVLSIGENVNSPVSVTLSDGFTAVSVNNIIMSVMDKIKRNVSLTLSIANPPHLDGGDWRDHM